jgi:cytochrome bd-type quinol oxidase subunit 2
MRFQSVGAGLSALCLLAGSTTLLAQDDSAASAGAAAGCLACYGGMMVLALVWIAISIALMVWVYRDAKARGMDNSVVWVFVIFFLGLIGLVIYLLVRPKGDLIPCSHCGNKRLPVLVKCPHCGA